MWRQREQRTQSALRMDGADTGSAACAVWRYQADEYMGYSDVSRIYFQLMLMSAVRSPGATAPSSSPASQPSVSQSSASQSAAAQSAAAQSAAAQSAAAPQPSPTPAARSHDADHERRFGGLQRLYGPDVLDRLAGAHMLVAGIGGVGTWCAEALARSGVGTITLVDLDHISGSNVHLQ